MTHQSDDNSTVILIDSSSDIDQIQELIQQENVLVITFDYESHKTLLKKKLCMKYLTVMLTKMI